MTERDDKHLRTEELLEQFTSALEALTKLVQSLVFAQTQQASDIGGVKSSIKSLEESMVRINELVHSGGQYPPLLSRVSVIEEKIFKLAQELDEQESLQEQYRETREEEEGNFKVVENNNSAQVKTAIISGVVAVVTAIISVLTQLL
jgi:hypothetical protein